MWRRRPAWMYLPHQCVEGITDDVRAKRRRTEGSEGDPPTTEVRKRWMSNGEDDGCDDAAAEVSEAEVACEEGRQGPKERPRGDVRGRPEDARAIHGRGASLGATAGRLEARDAAHRERVSGQKDNVAGGDHQPTIRGPPDGPGTGTIERRIRAQAKLDAKNAHLRTSLQQHAERVKKRAAEAQPAAETISAQERIMAIRRRLAERGKQSQEARPLGGGAVEAAGSTEAWEDRGQKQGTPSSGG
jgi:hypothetical protein